MQGSWDTVPQCPARQHGTAALTRRWMRAWHRRWAWGHPRSQDADALQQARTGPDPVAVGTTASTALTFLAMQKIPKFHAASPNLAIFACFFFFSFFLCQFSSKNSRQQRAFCHCVCVRS